MHPQPGLLFIVEHDEAVRTLLHRLLSAYGWEVRLFKTSHECFQAALTRRPACILVDLQPVGMNAVELSAALRSGDAACPMVILTSLVDSPLAAAARSAGAYAVLEKSCDASMLDATLRLAAAS